MRIPVELTIDVGQFENAKPTIEVEVPDGLTAVQQFWYLYDMFHKLSDRRPSHKETKAEDYPKGKYGKLQARKDGADTDNDAYLGTDMDRDAEVNSYYSEEDTARGEALKAGER